VKRDRDYVSAEAHLDALNHRPGSARGRHVFRLGRSLLTDATVVPTSNQLLSTTSRWPVGIHVAQDLWRHANVSRIARRRLAHGQERRAKEIISCNLVVPLGGCSAECAVDKSFQRAFHSTVGMGTSTNGYVESHRAVAKEKLRGGRSSPPAFIGGGLGVRLQRSEPPYASLQTMVGISPGAWRRRADE